MLNFKILISEISLVSSIAIPSKRFYLFLHSIYRPPSSHSKQRREPLSLSAAALPAYSAHSAAQLCRRFLLSRPNIKRTPILVLISISNSHEKVGCLQKCCINWHWCKVKLKSYPQEVQCGDKWKSTRLLDTVILFCVKKKTFVNRRGGVQRSASQSDAAGKQNGRRLYLFFSAQFTKFSQQNCLLDASRRAPFPHKIDYFLAFVFTRHLAISLSIRRFCRTSAAFFCTSAAVDVDVGCDRIIGSGAAPCLAIDATLFSYFLETSDKGWLAQAAPQELETE